MSARIIVADVSAGLASLPDGSAQCVVTSPPYWGLRDYGIAGQIGLEETPDLYLDRIVEVFREVRRVLRPDGTLWLNLGDCYVDGGGSRKARYGAGDRRVTRETSRRDRAAVTTRTPVAALKPKDMVGIPWRVAFALQADGWWLRSDIIWSKPNPMPESICDRPTKSHEYLFLLARSERYFYDQEAIAEPVAADTSARLMRAHAPHQAPGQAPHNGVVGGRPNRREPFPAGWGAGSEPRTAAEFNTQRRNRSPNGAAPAPQLEDRPGSFRETRNRRTVWEILTAAFPEAHFATFPPALVEPCILAGSRPGDTVLDPFCGAGTAGLVADRLGRSFVGIELNPEYAAMAERRIRGDAPLLADVSVGGA